MAQRASYPYEIVLAGACQWSLILRPDGTAANWPVWRACMEDDLRAATVESLSAWALVSPPAAPTPSDDSPSASAISEDPPTPTPPSQLAATRLRRAAEATHRDALVALTRRYIRLSLPEPIQVAALEHRDPRALWEWLERTYTVRSTQALTGLIGELLQLRCSQFPSPEQYLVLIAEKSD